MTFAGLCRLARVGLHLASGIAISASVMRACNAQRRARICQWWSGRLLHVLGVELRTHGAAPGGPCLVVANHISWLDVFALSAWRPMRFVCKSDVRQWPFIGWLVWRNEAIFVERGARTAIAQTNRAIVAALQAGNSVAVFPEGTSTDGTRVLPFHAATFQNAIDLRCEIRPLALRYLDAHGARSTAAAYCNDISFMASLRTIANGERLAVEIVALEPQQSDGLHRRELATRTHAAITTRLERGSADTATERSSCLRAAPPSGSRPIDNPNRAPAIFLRA